MITAIALSLQSGFKLAKQNKKAIIDTNTGKDGEIN
jgi:hypothetical protein